MTFVSTHAIVRGHVYKAAAAILVFACITVTGCAVPMTGLGRSPGNQATLLVSLLEPVVPKRGPNRFTVAVCDAAGQPLRDGTVRLTLSRGGVQGPKGYFDPPRRTTVQLGSGEMPGTYEGRGSIDARGSWRMTVQVDRDGKRVGTHTTIVHVR